jgi:hypothetical protein
VKQNPVALRNSQSKARDLAANNRLAQKIISFVASSGVVRHGLPEFFLVDGFVRLGDFVFAKKAKGPG